MEQVSQPDHDKHDLLMVVSRTIFSRIEGFRVQYEKPIPWHILALGANDHFRLTWSGGVIVDSDSSLPSY